MEELEFDAAFHLAGDQIIPNCMALKLISAQRHILVTTDRTGRQFDRLQDFFGWTGEKLSKCKVDAYDYSRIRAQLIEQMKVCQGSIGSDATKIAFNVTGGTKPMFAAAVDACRECGVTPIYFDTQERKIRFFTDEMKTLDLPPIFETVEEFVRLAGYTVSDSGKTPGELLSVPYRRAIKSFWTARQHIREQVVYPFSRAIPSSEISRKDAMKSYEYGCNALRNIELQDTRYGDLHGNWCALFQSYSEEAARFGGGGWFEAWVLCQLADAKDKARFRDLRTSVKIRPPAQGAISPDKTHQELDVVWTDGYKLNVIECKSGKVPQEAFQKLEKIVGDLGGAFGKGVICSAMGIDSLARDRLKFSRLSCVADRDLESLASIFDKLSFGEYRGPLFKP